MGTGAAGQRAAPRRQEGRQRSTLREGKPATHPSFSNSSRKAIFVVFQQLNVDIYVFFLVLKHLLAVSQDFVSWRGGGVLLLYFMAKPGMEFTVHNLKKLVSSLK